MNLDPSKDLNVPSPERLVSKLLDAVDAIRRDPGRSADVFVDTSDNRLVIAASLLLLPRPVCANGSDIWPLSHDPRPRDENGSLRASTHEERITELAEAGALILIEMTRLYEMELHRLAVKELTSGKGWDVSSLIPKMSNLSGRIWNAGWMDGTEFALWALIEGDSDHLTRGWKGYVTGEELVTLRLIRDASLRWVIWSDERGDTELISLEDFEPLYRAWRARIMAKVSDRWR